MNGLTLTTCCEALFVSDLQSSQHPHAPAVRDAVTHTLTTLGVTDCAARVAQEFGDHPETAVKRMRWAREMILNAYAAGRA